MRARGISGYVARRTWFGTRVGHSSRSRFEARVLSAYADLTVLVESATTS